jgi:hypothetical protein
VISGVGQGGRGNESGGGESKAAEHAVGSF